MHDKFMIYGVGYTGAYAARIARERGLNPLIAGRNAAKVKAIADRYGFEHTVFDLADKSAMEAALRKVDMILHTAGPFGDTAQQVMEACLATGTHYVDVAGEFDVYAMAASYDERARKAGVMLMPGGGYGVTVSDCLAAHMKNRMPDATELSFASSTLPFVSQGTMKTGVVSMVQPSRAWRNHEITSIGKPFHKDFDFGEGMRKCVSMGWGDVFTAHHTTGIPNITTYVEGDEQVEQFVNIPPLKRWFMRLAPVQSYLKKKVDRTHPAPPPYEALPAYSMIAVCEVRNAAGESAVSRLHTPDGYTVSAMTSIEIAGRIIAGETQPGFQTPAGLYGPDFILHLDRIRREDANI